MANNKLTDWDKLQKMLAGMAKEDASARVDEAALSEHLRSRVKGQDEVVADVSKLLRLEFSKERRNKPVANLLFLGPTGTGKTELAKAITEYLYQNEGNALRFDCSELTGDWAKSRLIGSHRGYVGSELGGQLTRPMFSNPKRVILFDEIEKASPTIFDLLLQLMGEGRLTEQGSGKTADFTQSIIILTSNAHAEEMGKIQKEHDDYHEMLNGLKSYLADTQVFRPELLGRIDKVYVFKSLEGMVVAEIALLKIQKLAKQFGVEVSFVAPELIVETLQNNKKVSRFGIRELERIVFEMFAESFVKVKESGHSRASLMVDASGKLKLTLPTSGKKDAA